MADNCTDLGDTSIGNPIQFDELGALTPAAFVWTGTQENGSAHFYSLGLRPAFPATQDPAIFGLTSRTLNGWIFEHDFQWTICYTSMESRAGNPERQGPFSRVVATGSDFQVFVPALDPADGGIPRKIHRFARNGGGGWNSTLVIDISTAMPRNQPVGQLIYYAPQIDARGSSSGHWSVSFLSMRQGANGLLYTNAMACVSQKNEESGPCLFLNKENQDQFLANTAVSKQTGSQVADYWFTYLNVNPTASPSFSLEQKAVYFTSEPDLPLGDILRSDIDPATWRQAPKCLSGVPCLAAGDYLGIASNGSLSAITPFITKKPPCDTYGQVNGLFILLPVDPPGEIIGSNFLPNVASFPGGSRLIDYGGVNHALQPSERGPHIGNRQASYVNSTKKP